MLKGGGIVNKGELWESTKDTLNVYTEYIHSIDWRD